MGICKKCEYKNGETVITAENLNNIQDAVIALEEQMENGGTGEITDEQIAAAVTAYLEENPVEAGATAEQAAQIEANRLAIEELQQSGTGAGLTEAQITALDGMFKIAAYTEDASAAYATFKTAFGIEDTHTHSYTSEVTTAATCTTDGVRTYTCSCGDSYTESIPATGHNYVDGVCSGCGAADPDYDEDVTLSSISATYSGGEVTAGTALTDLTGIVVTATYSDGSTATVTDYTLSGEIAEGENTITVSYGGMTTTFTVTGVAESGGETVTVGFSTLDQTVGIMQTSGTATTTSSARHVQFPYIDGMFVSTYFSVTWNNNGFSPFIVYDNGEYLVPEFTIADGVINYGQFTTALSGYSENAIVYANFKDNGTDENCYYSYES